MLNRGLIGSVVLATALWMSVGSAWTFDESKYPDLKGQWQRIGAPRWAKASGYWVGAWSRALLPGSA